MADLAKIISLAKRRGFVYPGSEIYGGLAGTWDYGPLGVLLKENIKQEWWKHMLRRPDIYPLDAAILMNSKTWEASGHLKNFTDKLVDCKKCKKRFRADQLINTKKCSECGGKLTEGRPFQLMFKTYAGPVEDSASEVYLRPETAQGIFVNFKNIIDSFHPALPFGVAQVGKAFRNEITPQHFLFRAREFEQMELEYFGKPDDMDRAFDEIKAARMEWYNSLGVKKENIRFRDHAPSELSHYSRRATDIEYNYELTDDGFSELEGIAYRGDFDLSVHAKFSGEKFEIDGITPHVVEPSLGLDRAILCFLVDAYEEDELNNERRVVLKLHPKLAPIKAAVFPLVANKENIVKKAREVYEDLWSNLARGLNFRLAWDDIGNIGKRYRRQDEIGTPWCITIDYQTLEDDTVTIRDRDTAKQERYPAVKIADIIQGSIEQKR